MCSNIVGLCSKVVLEAERKAQGEHRYVSISRSLLPYNRSLLPYNRSLLPYNRSLLTLTHTLGMPLYQQVSFVCVIGLFCHMIGLF
jgi:hypothetical protein